MLFIFCFSVLFENDCCTVKKWASIGKELFTTADNYIISINEAKSDTYFIDTIIFNQVIL